MDLLARQIETEAEAWTLLIQSLNLPEAEIRSFLKAWKLSNQLIQKRFTISTRFAFSLE